RLVTSSSGVLAAAGESLDGALRPVPRLPPAARDLVAEGRDAAAEHALHLAVRPPAFGRVRYRGDVLVALPAQVGAADGAHLLRSLGELLDDHFQQVSCVLRPPERSGRGAAVVVVLAEACEDLVNVDVPVARHDDEGRLDVLVQAVR